MTNNLTPNQSDTTKHLEEKEIDMRQVYGSLLRHRGLIAKITSASVVLMGLYAFYQKPVWEGQFEIVLASGQSTSSQASSLLRSNPDLANLIGASGGNNQLETEVEILESPSVLKPVFDFVKQHKNQQGIDTRELRYSDWLKKNLTIELVKGTSVLELAFRDTDKTLVLPAIQRISDAYQEYSGRDRERGIKQAIQYLDQQIEIYSKKSIGSLRAAQEYATEQNLTALQGNGSNDFEIKNSLNIEAIRIGASNRIRNINEQLKQMNQLDSNPETLMYVGRNIPELASQGLPQMLDRMDTRLALLRAKYTDRDDSIRRLLEKRRLLIDVFKRQTYGYLYAQRSAAQARLKSAERPKGVLIQYRESCVLLHEMNTHQVAIRTSDFGAEQARKEDPWELISTPTLLDKPVAPRKKRFVALGLLAGFIAGSGAALLVDRRTGHLQRRRTEKPTAMSANQTSSFNGQKHLERCGRPRAAAVGRIKQTVLLLIPIGNIPKDQLKAFSAELAVL